MIYFQCFDVCCVVWVCVRPHYVSFVGLKTRALHNRQAYTTFPFISHSVHVLNTIGPFTSTSARRLSPHSSDPQLISAHGLVIMLWLCIHAHRAWRMTVNSINLIIHKLTPITALHPPDVKKNYEIIFL